MQRETFSTKRLVTGRQRLLISGLIIFTIAVLFAGCEGVTGIIIDMPPSTPGEIPPFVITKPEFEIIERPYHFRYAGIVFKFLNQADLIVDRITVSFLLFDPRTQESPFVGSNKFAMTKRDIVFPDDNKEIIISLDQFIYVAPTTPYLIDFFYIYEIQYVDGSVWRDEYGKFRVRE